ncbi:hypothetical protein OG884_16025 [Streptosporangium sp. NBC_01755]|uniref:hypothetical protein n=1 Tax=unclassified Streptosporangium TaxID=2632669 RepID=UPI002DDB5BCB|nr:MULTISPECIES: hypothetical protein [unclassified Streptosporangium]WSA25344.1 hypothetical protein OIE13_31210 [Streptosporangium sp. NBC_01810]WSD03340.1 hypothetical protein OG884_16025 [Streptosporangium sp. NBC_01755]
MRRSISKLLGLAAATAVIVIGVPALATPASAATLTAGPAASSDYDESWGSYYSKYYDDSRASAKGRVWTDDDDRVHLQGRVYDRYSPNRLCGYVQFKFENHDGDENYYWARKCGSQGYTPFHFSEEEVDNLQVRVCYWDRSDAKKTLCGRWRYIYEVDGEE